MGSPERSRSPDVKSDRARDDEEVEGDDRKKRRSGKYRKSGSAEEVDGLESSGRRRSSDEKSESRKRSAGSNKGGSDEDDYDLRKELRLKHLKKKQEESALESLSNWYQDGEGENKHDGGGEKSGNKGQDGERRKSAPKLPDRESRSKGRDIRSHDGEFEKPHEKDSRYSERKESSSREKSHGSSDHGRSQRKRWDEVDGARKVDESDHVGKSDPITEKSDLKHENVGYVESGQGKNRVVDIIGDKGLKSHDRAEKGVNFEKNNAKGNVEPLGEDNKENPSMLEDVPSKERLEDHRKQRDPAEDHRQQRNPPEGHRQQRNILEDNRQQRNPPEDHRQQRNPSGPDNIQSRERSVNADEDGTWMRDRGRRETDRSNRSRTPERSGRRHHEADYNEIDVDKSAFRRKDPDNEGYRDERLKGRDDWKRRQPNFIDKEMKDGDVLYDYGRDWELQRRGRDRADNERPMGRAGGRKDGNRTEAVKTSSNYGISNDNYDVIEIQTKPFNYGRDESRSSFAKNIEGSQQSDMKRVQNDEMSAYPRENMARSADAFGPGSGEDSKDRFMDDGPSNQRGAMANRAVGGQTSSNDSQPAQGNQEPGSFNRGGPQGVKGNRMGRGGRGRPTGRDVQQVGIPMPMMGTPFGPMGMPPPGPVQPVTPSMSPGPGPISPGLFMPQFSPPLVWPGGRGVEMNMLAVAPGLSPVPPGPSGPRFPPNIGAPPSPMFFNQPGPGRGMPPNIAGPTFNSMVPIGRGQSQEKASGGWVPPRTNGPPGKAPSRGEQNDYSQNFVDTGMRPQNFIRELELTSVVEDYPKLRELIQKKDEIVAKSATAPMYYKCDLREQVLVPEFFGTKFDVILVDPPWEEYVHRAPGVTDHMEYWTFEEIMNLKIEAIADTPSFIFLWVGDGLGLEQGRQCLKKWGFRRCEDICWVKTNKTNATPGLRHDSHTLFQRSKEHCLMGIKGTVRRSTDGHIIHANIDTDVIIAEEPPYGSTAKPEDMYRIIEHFSLGRRRLELFGEDHNIRSGWLTVGKGLSSSNFNAEAYVRNFADKDGKVWQGGGGRNPPPEAGHLVLTTPDIEALRPKSPMKNQQQMQQQSNSISLTMANSSNKRPTGNSPSGHGVNQEASSSIMSAQVPWGPPMDGFKGGMMGMDDRVFDMYGYNVPPFGPMGGDYLDFETQRAMNMM